MTPYDGFGARLTDPAHVPYVQHFKGTQESPAEIEVRCSCGEWDYFSQASAGGGCNTDWEGSWGSHLESASEDPQE